MMGAANEELEFEPLFNLRGGASEHSRKRRALTDPDSREGWTYRMPAELHLAVEVALTTGRPLLLRGDPGTGKSSLAPYIARRLGWRYYEHVVTSTSTATDILWRFDAVRRLSDAQAQKSKPERDYVEPGALWWALDRHSALNYAGRSGGKEPQAELNEERDQHRAVVLIDEIDKAHPDLPNGLLVAIGSHRIAVPYLNEPIELSDDAPALALPEGVEVAPVLVVITTNEERELPAAFLRRCVAFCLLHPVVDELVEIARMHFERPEEPFAEADETLARNIAERVKELRKGAPAGEHRPSTAEFLDAFRCCRRRAIAATADDPRWQLIERITLAKPPPVMAS